MQCNVGSLTNLTRSIMRVDGLRYTYKVAFKLWCGEDLGLCAPFSDSKLMTGARGTHEGCGYDSEGLGYDGRMAGGTGQETREP